MDPQSGQGSGSYPKTSHSYDNASGKYKLKIVFEEGGKAPARPVLEHRIYRQIVQATVDSGNTSTVSYLGQSPEQQQGQQELDLLRGITRPLENGGRTHVARNNQGVGRFDLEQALSNPPSHRNYSPMTEVDTSKKIEGDEAIDEPISSSAKEGTHNRLDTNRPPLASIYDIFDSITGHALKHGFLEACKPFKDSGLRVMTMCSGTESPFVSMDLVRKSLSRQGQQDNFKYTHVGSVEIEPWKQAFIERNFQPPVIFRDALDFIDHGCDLENEALYPVTAYGARTKPEGGAHILIAGSSCVDYSSLNKNAPGLQGKRGEGESAQTMDGVVAYARAYQPTLLILENVCSAPWSAVEALWHEHGYATVPLLLNSLDYYLPQTRQRGYMFGIHKEHAKVAGLNVDHAIEQWVAHMAAFQRRASSPYSDFLLRPDDQRLLAAKDQSVGESSGESSSHTWIFCRQRHVKVRAVQQLGIGTPYTNRRGNSKAKLPDQAWQIWALGQPKRVLDFLDIHHLACVAQRDFDSKFKHRNIDISQNADRDEDRRQWGVVNAITPSGCLFDTRRGGPVVGLEVFALQGFPLEDLNLGLITSKNLQDLSGNAMTTTVVAAGIISAVLACNNGPSSKSIFSKHALANPRSSDKDVVRYAEEVNGEGHPLVEPELENLIPHQHRFSESNVWDADKIRSNGAGYQPLCRCEGLDRRSKENLLYCPHCNYICCSGCSRETHGLEKLSLLFSKPTRKDRKGERPIARDFIILLTKFLPPVLKLSNEAEVDCMTTFTNAKFVIAKPQIYKALQSLVHFQSIKFERSWKVVYESDDCVLELEFVHKRRLCETWPCPVHEKCGKRHLHVDVEPMWYLFARAPDSTPAKSPLRDILQHPIARMKPHGNLFKGRWELWNGPTQNFRVHVKGNGTQIPSWEQRLGLEQKPFNSLMAYSTLEVTCLSGEPTTLKDIFGTYELLQDCPAASGTLHKKVLPDPMKHNEFVGLSTKAPMFLFLKPAHIGDARFDQVVFSTHPPHNDMLDDRTVLARLAAFWRPVATFSLSQGMNIDCESLNDWSVCDRQTLQVPLGDNVLRSWRRDINIPFVRGMTCDGSNSTLLLVDLNLDLRAMDRLRKRRDLIIELEQKPDALTDFRWIVSYASSTPLLSKQWNSVLHLMVATCSACCPLPPGLRWATKVIGTNTNVQPVEYSVDAARYEHLLKSRPRSALARLLYVHERPMLEVRVNVPTMAHRASAQLFSSGLPNPDCISLEWRLIPYQPFAPHPPFPIVKIRSNGMGSAYRHQYEMPAGLKRSLWDSQVRVLAWMSRQESSPPEWTEMALVEACLPSLAWSIEARALLKKSEVRGGVIADDVGAGKTTTSLALISRDYHLRALAQTTFEAAKPLEPGKIGTDATLVLVPKNLHKQWEDELNACLGWDKLEPRGRRIVKRPYYIAASNTAALQHYSLDDIKKATIVLIPWDIFNESAYWIFLQKISCSPCVPVDPGRAFQDWLDENLAKLGNCVLEPHNDQDIFWDQWEKNRSDDKQFDRFEGYVTRATNKAAIAAKRAATKKDVNRTSEQAQAEKNILTPQQCRLKAQADLRNDLDAFRSTFKEKKKIPVLLHMFRFRRLIVDEFTYIQGKTLLALMRLAASARWLLSGTPPIHDFDSVNTMAKLLNTQVATFDEKDGKYGFGRDGLKMSNDKSEAQKFHAHQQQISASYKKQVYGHAKLFLDKFARKNPPSLARAEKTARQVLFDLTPCERIIYLDVQAIAMHPDRTFNKGSARENAGNAQNEPVSLQLLADLVEQTSGVDAARICSSLLMEKVWQTANSSPPSAPTVPQQLGQIEHDRFENILGEQEHFVKSQAEELLGFFRNLWYLEGLARVQQPAAAKSFEAFVENVKADKISDPASFRIVDRLLWSAREHPLATISRGLDEGFDRIMADVGERVERILGGLRRLRLVDFVSRLVYNEPLGSCSKCALALDLEGVRISTSCGHVLCRRCDSAKLQCCSLTEGGIPAQLFRRPAVEGPSGTVMCSRMRAAMALTTRAMEGGNKVLVFAQFEGMKDAFLEACSGANVPKFNGFGSGAAAAVAGFKLAAEAAVLVLKVDSPDAAGWNIQFANVVVFLAPVLAASVEEGQATMEQAVGRCWRPGQSRHVFVYVLGASGTIESSMVVKAAGFIKQMK